MTEAIADRITGQPLRVAVYCLVAEPDMDGLSLDAQQQYYEEKIALNPAWRMVGIFADETAANCPSAKRPAYQRMMEQCCQKTIDIILTKSIASFARNMAKMQNCIAELKELDIAVIFEQHKINSLDDNANTLLNLLAEFAEAEYDQMKKWRPHGYCRPKFDSE